MLKLESWIETWLLAQAEYRMGCHKVIATLNTGGKETGFVVNSQIFFKEADLGWELRLMSWSEIVAAAASSSLVIKQVAVIPREPETLHGVRQIALANEKYARLSQRKLTAANSAYGSQKSAIYSEAIELGVRAANAAAEYAPVTLTIGGEIFKRFSAFSNDRRVTAGKGLQPGTFATTKDDADPNVKTGTDAVSRYALPNPTPASNVFTISPSVDTDLKRGTAQPANNQPGGGVEVIFVNGLPNGTVAGPSTIPDK